MPGVCLLALSGAKGRRHPEADDSVRRRISLLPFGFCFFRVGAQHAVPEAMVRLSIFWLFSCQRAKNPRPEGLSHPQHDSRASKRVPPISTRLLYHNVYSIVKHHSRHARPTNQTTSGSAFFTAGLRATADLPKLVARAAVLRLRAGLTNPTVSGSETDRERPLYPAPPYPRRSDTRQSRKRELGTLFSSTCAPRLL